MNLTYIIISVVLIVLSLVFEHLEQKSKRWYLDRRLLRISGACVALACWFLFRGITG